MITRDQIKKGKRVSYTSRTENRPWLKNSKLTLTGDTSAFGNSTLVSWESNDGSKGTEWIGFSALTPLNNGFEESIEALKAERDKLNERTKAINLAIETLESINV